MTDTLWVLPAWIGLVVSTVLYVHAEVTRQGEQRKLERLGFIILFLLMVRDTFDAGQADGVPTVVTVSAYLASAFGFFTVIVLKAMKLARVVMLATLVFAVILFVQRVVVVIG